MNQVKTSRRRETAFVVAVFTCFALLGWAYGEEAKAAFGFSNLEVSVTGVKKDDPVEAGIHPYAMRTTVEFKTKEVGSELILPDEEPKNVIVDLPPGFIGNPNPVPTCPDALFAKVDQFDPASACPASTAIGVAEIAASFEPAKTVEELYETNKDTGLSPMPVYNLDPPPGVASKFGFIVIKVPVTVEVKVNPNPPYNVIAEVTNISNLVQAFGSKLTLWGNPADESHDDERGVCARTVAPDLCPSGLAEVIPFLTLPANCKPMITTFKGDSWVHPGAFTAPESRAAVNAETPPGPGTPTACEELDFEPEIKAEPTTASAASASGLDFDLHMDNEGLLEPEGRSEATIEKAAVTMPKGVTANTSVSLGLQACSPGDLQKETLQGFPGEGCPQASKIGEVEVETPILEGKLIKGQVYVATPFDNPFDSLLAAYVVIREPELGVFLKLPGKIETDPQTGQLVTKFGEPGAELPQLPFSDFRFNLRGGPRAPLAMPRTCGTYEVKAELTPSSGQPAITKTSSFEVTSGPGGSPCPPANPPLDPGFEAGSDNNKASAFSPFYMRLTRDDLDPDITRLGATLPQGVVAKIAGLGRCGDAEIAAAKAKTGKAELASPSCPQSSEVGRLLAGTGYGDALNYVPGKLYLAGPYNGNPLSILAVVPAVSGPFDLGTVVTRVALDLDRSTAQAKIDPAASDPIPQILQGVPVGIRDLRIYVDRPGFTTTPTGCDVRAVTANVFGSVLATDLQSSASLSQRYQAADCANLSFKPKLRLRLKGGTKRTAHPALSATLTFPYPSGPGGPGANVKRAVVTLPPSEFLDQAHISNPCTRVQYAVDACPAKAKLGVAKAFTPLLDNPLQGAIWFRSNGGERELPDVVADLRGEGFKVDLVGFIDQKRGGIRTTFATVPDVPVTKFTFNLFGGKRGLLVNSENLCRKPRKANYVFLAQNGKRLVTSPAVKTSCGKGKGKKGKGKGGKGKKGR